MSDVQVVLYFFEMKKLCLILGPCPSEDYGTEAHFKVTDALQEGEWSATISSVDGENLVLSVISPSDARIGKYALSLETSTGTEENSCNLGEFFLLFNPWCPGM